MSDYESENYQSTNEYLSDNENNIKIKKERKKANYVYTPAREASFKRMLEIKQLKQKNKVNKKQEEKQIKKEVIKKTRDKIKKMPIDKLKIEEEEDNIIEPIKIKKQKPKKKQQEIIESDNSTDSENYETDTDDDNKKIIEMDNKKVLIKTIRKKPIIIKEDKPISPVIKQKKKSIKPIKPIQEDNETSTEEDTPIKKQSIKKPIQIQKSQPKIIFT